jgi:hypothetical protein
MYGGSDSRSWRKQEQRQQANHAFHKVLNTRRPQIVSQV